MDDVASPVDLPHHYQRTEYTCGPASLKMVLDGILGESAKERDLADLLGSNDFHGTRQRVLLRYIESLGLRAFEHHTDTTVDDIRRLMSQGHVVLVCYFIPEDDIDHYAVVQRIGLENMVLWDPWFGPGRELRLTDFESHWYSDDRVDTRRHRWLLAIKVPDAPRMQA